MLNDTEEPQIRSGVYGATGEKTVAPPSDNQGINEPREIPQKQASETGYVDPIEMPERPTTEAKYVDPLTMPEPPPVAESAQLAQSKIVMIKPAKDSKREVDENGEEIAGTVILQDRPASQRVKDIPGASNPAARAWVLILAWATLIVGGLNVLTTIFNLFSGGLLGLYFFGCMIFIVRASSGLLRFDEKSRKLWIKAAIAYLIGLAATSLLPLIGQLGLAYGALFSDATAGLALLAFIFGIITLYTFPIVVLGGGLFLLTRKPVRDWF
jgi:hypothetical protein